MAVIHSSVVLSIIARQHFVSGNKDDLFRIKKQEKQKLFIYSLHDYCVLLSRSLELIELHVD